MAQHPNKASDEQVRSALHRIGNSPDGKLLIAHLTTRTLKAWGGCATASDWPSACRFQGQHVAYQNIATDLGFKKISDTARSADELPPPTSDEQT